MMHLELLPIVRERGTLVSGQIYRASVHSEGIFKRVTAVQYQLNMPRKEGDMRNGSGETYLFKVM